MIKVALLKSKDYKLSTYTYTTKTGTGLVNLGESQPCFKVTMLNLSASFEKPP